MIVGFLPGGSTDITARTLAPKLYENLGQSVVVENLPGASTAIATEKVAKSPADGYTLLLAPSSTAIVSALRTNLPYDLERDLAPVSLVLVGPFVFTAHPSMPARNVKELIALARSQPGKLNYGSPGIGSANHLAGELFNLMAKVKIAHVPYKGSAASALAAATGEVDMLNSSITAVLPFLAAGRLRALAVTGLERSSLLRSVPTLSESGLPGYKLIGWNGVLAPAGVPKNIIARLNAAIAKTVNTPEMKESINKQGFEPQSSTPEQFAEFIRNEIAQYAKLVELAGLKGK